MKQKVVVFGSYVTDLCARTTVFPKKGETVQGKSFSSGPGGKGSNQAVAAKRAGADVEFVTKLGGDIFGKEALNFYESEKLLTDKIIVDNQDKTGTALIMVNDETAQNQIIVVSGACGNITEGDIKPVLEETASADWLLIQLETNLEPVEALIDCAFKHGVRVILNPAPAKEVKKELFSKIEILTPNESEAESFSGIHVNDEESARKAADYFHKLGVNKVVITMGVLGCYASDGKEGKMFPVISCGNVVDTTGAGDAFSGGLAAALSRGMPFFEAVKYGSCTAGLAVTRFGTAPAMPYQEEIDSLYGMRILQ